MWLGWWEIKMNNDLTGIVLAGGLSTRMGRDKASLPWGDSDLLHTVLARLVPVCNELIVVSNIARDIAVPGVKIVTDRFFRCGPLGGMHAGLLASTNNYNFIVACDMPNLNTAAVAYIREVAAGYAVAVPFIDGYFNPLHAVYHKSCLPHIERLLAEERYRILEFYPLINLRQISEEELRQFDPELRTLDNINTPDDMQSSC
jgi:molybdopterin-guanine dinucleotide biosynthesis protein A